MDSLLQQSSADKTGNADSSQLDSNTSSQLDSNASSQPDSNASKPDNNQSAPAPKKN